MRPVDTSRGFLSQCARCALCVYIVFMTVHLHFTVSRPMFVALCAYESELFQCVMLCVCVCVCSGC